jgi:hypothetical protein
MSEEIGNVFKSKISSPEDDASIVEAFSVYHYGTDNYDPLDPVPPESIEGHFVSVNNRVDSLESVVDNLGTTYVLKLSPIENPNIISTNNAASVPLTIRGQSAQTADLQRWVANDGTTILGKVDSTGKMFSNNVEVVNLSSTQTLTNKTISGGTVNATTLQENSIAVVTVSGTQTLTNKTLTSPIISGGSISEATSITLTGNQTVDSFRTRNIRASTSNPTGGNDGDVWLRY